MEERGCSRRTLLKGAVAALGLAAVPLASSATTAEAAAAKNMPWAYTVQDPTKVAKRAYEVFYSASCAEATWWSLVEALSKDASNPDQALWGSLPKMQFRFGGSGVRHWGTVCGTLIGSPAIIHAVGAPDTLVDAIMVYYAQTPLPTKGADNAVRAGWVPAAPAPMPMPNVPALRSDSQLCHASLTQWLTYTGNKADSPQWKDRCSKAAFDIAYRTVELLNAWKTAGTIPVVKLDPTVASCATPSCHGAQGESPTKGKMGCGSCHDDYSVDHAMP